MEPRNRLVTVPESARIVHSSLARTQRIPQHSLRQETQPTARTIHHKSHRTYLHLSKTTGNKVQRPLLCILVRKKVLTIKATCPGSSAKCNATSELRSCMTKSNQYITKMTETTTSRGRTPARAEPPAGPPKMDLPLTSHHFLEFSGA